MRIAADHLLDYYCVVSYEAPPLTPVPYQSISVDECELYDWTNKLGSHL